MGMARTDTTGPGPQKLFLLYFDPAQASALRIHGFVEGTDRRVNVFAANSMSRQNNVIIAHEFLHTPGATDSTTRQ